jgi:glycosyltransferase involved in cell wall biosynthesis
VKKHLPNAEFHLYGGGGGHNAQAKLEKLACELGLSESVRFFGRLSLDQMPQVIANADLGVVPKRADSFGNEAYSTKIMEFMSQGVPVIASRTKVDTFYFDGSTVRFFASGDDQALAEAILEVAEHVDVRQSLIASGYAYVDQHNWDRRKKDYLDLVDSLLTDTAPSAVQEGSASITKARPERKQATKQDKLGIQA